MQNLYDLHSWSKHYREELLGEAQWRHLLEQTKLGQEQPSGSRRLGSALRDALAPLLREVSGVAGRASSKERA